MLSGVTGAPCLVGDIEEAEQHVRRRVLDHERAASLPPQHQALGGQPSMALRAVPWLTPNSLAISNSLGIS